MKRYFTYNSFFKLFTVALFAGVLVSCGTSRDRVYQDSDGIYGSTAVNTETVQEQEDFDNRNYYKQYFQTKAQVYTNEPEDDIIFTDVEGYTSVNGYVDEDGMIHEEEVHQNESYGPWGETSEITINVYNNPGWGYYGYWNRPLWWYGSGWGISYWHHGWGGFYGPYWGWSYSYWGYPYYAFPGHYYGPYYGGYNNYVAYNRGRRNTDYRPNRTTTRINAAAATTNRSNQSRYSRTEVERRINNSRSSQERTMRSVPSRTDQTRPVQQNNNNQRGIINNQRNNPTPNTTRPNTNIRNSGNTTRSGGTNVRSSGSSGTRSGGAVRSSGGRGGRG